MKFTKNIGMVLLGVYLIIDGLLGFGLNLGPFVFLLYLVALAAGVLILSTRRWSPYPHRQIDQPLIRHSTLSVPRWMFTDLLVQRSLHLRREFRADACFFMFEINKNFEPV